MPKETGHEASVIGEYTEDHNSSTEHLNKPPRLPSPEPINGDQSPASDDQQDREKRGMDGVADNGNADGTVNGMSHGQAGGEDVGVVRDFAYPAEGYPDMQYPAASHDEGLRTSAGPPIGIPHPENLELGTIGQHPDPSNENDDIEPYFAVPGGPGVQMLEEEDENDPNAFFHPASKEPMRILWLPKDELGLAEAEIETNAKFGIPSVHRYATFNAKVSSYSPLVSS